MFGTLFVGKQSDVFSVNILEGDQKEEESREPSKQHRHLLFCLIQIVLRFVNKDNVGDGDRPTHMDICAEKPL